MVLEASALANGSRAAASIAGRRDNRTKLKDGEALFKSVRIEAESPGVYTLCANYAAGEVRTFCHRPMTSAGPGHLNESARERRDMISPRGKSCIARLCNDCTQFA